MKRFFLLFLGVLAFVGANSATISGTGISGTTSNTVQTIVVSTPGALADWVASVTGDNYDQSNPYQGLGADNLKTLQISGTLSAADLEALSSVTCTGFAGFDRIDMTGVTLAEGVTDTDVMAIDFAGAEFIALPYGVTDAATIATLTADEKNASLQTAGTYEADTSGDAVAADPTQFTAYSFQKGHVKSFIDNMFGSLSGNQLEKLTLGGTIAASDIYQGGTVFSSSSLTEMDLTESSFEPCNVAIQSHPMGSVGGQGSTYAEMPAELGQTLPYNALYYLKYYSLTTCALPDPSNPLGGNTEIPPHAFTNNGNVATIQNITIPEGYTKIGTEAFFGHRITTLVLPSTMENVEAGAFASLEGGSVLEDVTMTALKGNCEFGDGAFARNNVLKHVTLSEGVTEISDHMFDQCYLLESIRIPSTCVFIGSYAFFECWDLHSIIIPEGVQYIYQAAFENTGLTDIYVMATRPTTVPKIIAISPTDPNQNRFDSTFSYQRTTGFNTFPSGHRNGTTDDFTNLQPDFDEVMTWYQDEMSGENGLGSGNALVALHYPDEMKPFYEGIDIFDFYTIDDLTYDDGTVICGVMDSGRDGGTGWLDYIQGQINGLNAKGLAQNKVNGTYGSDNYNGASNATTDEETLQYLPQAYSVNSLQHESAAWRMGPDKDNRYYPNQIDYIMRMAAGATDNGIGQCFSAWGWRQFPLAYSIGDMGKVPFEKQYDDTWYTMCFPWHMTDEQLFEAFNQDMEITEYVGAELIEQPESAEDNRVYALVFHFDDVAVTTYRDNNDVQYDREKVGHRLINGEDRSIYRYTSKDGNNTVVTYPLEYKNLQEQTVNSGVKIPDKDDTSATAVAIREAYGNYLSIQNILSLAGRPYMIHPSIGAKPGNPATVYINAEMKTESPWTTAEQAVEKTATIDDQLEVGGQNKGGQTPFVNPFTGGGGKYTFIGNVGKVSDTDTDVEETTGNRVMPTPAYFLAVEKTGTQTVVKYKDVEELVYEADGKTPVWDYQYQEGGNYNQVVTPAYYEWVGEGNGDYTASAWEASVTAGTGHYTLVPATTEYVAAGSGTHTATSWEQVTSGTGHYSQNTQTVSCYEWSRNYGTFEVTSETPRVGGPYDKVHYSATYQGDIDVDYFVFVGEGNGSYDVSFGPYTQTAWGSGPNGYNSSNATVTSYVYQGPSGGGNYEATNFTEKTGGEVNYVPMHYEIQTGGNYDATAYTALEGGEWLYHPELVEYVATGEGEGSYVQVQKTRIVQVEDGTEEVPIYAKYPKYFRKKTTTGYKWSKYSAIIQPDADAIANIEAFLDFSAAANGFNVAIGEWEVVTPTAIEEILGEAERNSQPVQRIHLNVVYNVKGQVVRTGDTSLEGLPKGLYIVNGKKYMVK